MNPKSQVIRMVNRPGTVICLRFLPTVATCRGTPVFTERRRVTVFKTQSNFESTEDSGTNCNTAEQEILTTVSCLEMGELAISQQDPPGTTQAVHETS